MAVQAHHPTSGVFSSQDFQFGVYFFEASILPLKFGCFKTCLHALPQVPHNIEWPFNPITQPVEFFIAKFSISRTLFWSKYFAGWGYEASTNLYVRQWHCFKTWLHALPQVPHDLGRPFNPLTQPAGFFIAKYSIIQMLSYARILLQKFGCLIKC